MAPSRYAVYGLFGIECGLTVSAENTVRVLRENARQLSKRAIDHDGTLTAEPLSGAIDVNLFHANPNWLERAFKRTPAGVFAFRRRLNACAVFWELERMPTEWLPMLSAMDVLMAPTEFIAGALATSLPDATVVRLPQAAFLPDGIAPDRARFGIPGDAFAVAMSFSSDSGVDRKNPVASIRAFFEAFGDDPRARLVVRVNTPTTETPVELMAALRDAAGDDSRLVLVGGDLDYASVLSLYASCDVYLSLHRAEGLGLGPMEAMSLGRAVVATGWSGNTDFMTPENSCPVAYTLVPVDVPESSPYATGVVEGSPSWAEPDVADATAKLRALRDDPSLLARVGAAAAESMRLRRAEVLRGSFLGEVEAAAAAALGGDAAASRAHEQRSAALAAIARAARWAHRKAMWRARLGSVYRGVTGRNWSERG